MLCLRSDILQQGLSCCCFEPMPWLLLTVTQSSFKTRCLTKELYKFSDKIHTPVLKIGTTVKTETKHLDPVLFPKFKSSHNISLKFQPTTEKLCHCIYHENISWFLLLPCGMYLDLHKWQMGLRYQVVTLKAIFYFALACLKARICMLQFFMLPQHIFVL